VIVAGSVRREMPDCGDIDFVCTTDDWEILEPIFREGNFFDEKNLLKKDGTFKTGTKDGLTLEFYVGPIEGLGALMQFATGSAAHNVMLRRKALKLGYKVNQYGIWKGDERVAGETEEDFYEALGLEYPEPQDRSLEWKDLKKG